MNRYDWRKKDLACQSLEKQPTKNWLINKLKALLLEGSGPSVHAELLCSSAKTWWGQTALWQPLHQTAKSLLQPVVALKDKILVESFRIRLASSYSIHNWCRAKRGSKRRQKIGKTSVSVCVFCVCVCGRVQSAQCQSALVEGRVTAVGGGRLILILPKVTSWHATFLSCVFLPSPSKLREPMSCSWREVLVFITTRQRTNVKMSPVWQSASGSLWNLLGP